MITTLKEYKNATPIERLEFIIKMMQEIQDEDSTLDYSEQIANARKRINELKQQTQKKQ